MIVLQITAEELECMFNRAIDRALPKSVPDEHSTEIISRQELMSRLDVTEPTVIRYERKGSIPSMRIGNAVRYDWQKVLKSLEVKKKGR